MSDLVAAARWVVPRAWFFALKVGPAIPAVRVEAAMERAIVNCEEVLQKVSKSH